ncbi:MAG: glycosyl hydrolase 115 family protein [Spirochaetales bacterium]|nr:glycosyl hydrolase 115 family protein [Spirochaetales bacterium]
MQILTPKTQYLSAIPVQGAFELIQKEKLPQLIAGDNEHPGVIHTMENLKHDLFRVSGLHSKIKSLADLDDSHGIIIGTFGQSTLIDQLVEKKLLNLSELRGKWDAYQIQTLSKIGSHHANSLAIIGSNKRGTIYGIYDLCRRMGVSPWHWWADVPVKQHKELYVMPGTYFSGEPAVKYRGFFINDEYPCLGTLAHEKFGGFNHHFYTHVFDLLLRLRGNYLWPAMWDDCFHDDDPENTGLADKLGVIMGTSHHEPLMRAWKEWQRYGNGSWDLEQNREALESFWREGVRRQGNREAIMTVGMRGDGDEALTEESREELLQDILCTQRKILEEESGKKPHEIPQMWAVYKEVQDYYEKGISIPEDILIMLCDDNWGNIRKLPLKKDRGRPGGYGLYYHLDYVGGPRNYKWMASSPLPRIWEQLHIAFQGGINKLWIVNTGDIKPLEFPLSFFMDLSWNPEHWNHDELGLYTEKWTSEQFGDEFSQDIAELIDLYLHYNGRRKPELLGPETYSHIHYHEAEKIIEDFNALKKKALDIKTQLPQKLLPAFYQLVEFPILASLNLTELHVLTGRNHLYAKQGRSATNKLAARVKELFQIDKELCDFYNHQLAEGKWNHMMDQTHISYSYWQQPEKDVLPDLTSLELEEKAEMGVAIEGSDKWWPLCQESARLPELINHKPNKGRYIEIFNRGKNPFNFSIDGPDWLMADLKKGKITDEKRIYFRVNWSLLPLGEYEGRIRVSGAGSQVIIILPVVNQDLSNPVYKDVFMEENNCVSIEAAHYSRGIDPPGAKWTVIPGLSRTHSGVTTLPYRELSLPLSDSSPFIEFKAYFRTKGTVHLTCYFCPTNPFTFDQGLYYGISMEDEKPQLVDIHDPSFHENPEDAITHSHGWHKAVGNNIHTLTTCHQVKKTGIHHIRYWMIDQGLVLQKIVLWKGPENQCYLGPPESYCL